MTRAKDETTIDEAPAFTTRMGDDTSGVTSLETSLEGKLEARTSMSSLSVGEVIGEGGMGVVRSAVQNSLDRNVAIKIAHTSADGTFGRRMLAEAWVTGYLEHPGVVPVYDIVRTETGDPVVVMRRINGATWEERIADAGWAASQGARDLLEQNLRTIVRLAEIVEFAHAKGVIHRDIKPANVMLGSFGEIYLLDWGLAVATSDEAAVHLARASTIRDMGGTLHYAAPEMIGLADAHISEATDVYLLGAVLYEIARGRAPHDYPTAPRTFESIAASPPTDWADVPPRLAAIGQRAMQKLPTNRYSTVAAFRRDVLDVLRSRDSEHVSAGARRALTALVEACKERGARRKIYDLYGECRFGFREALRTWPGNEEAAAGLETASTLVIEHELVRDPRVASALLDDAQNISPDLIARVRRAVAADAEERAVHSRIAHDHDQMLGRRTRVAIFGAFGVAWAASQFAAERIGPNTHLRFAIGSLIQLPLLGFAWWVARDRSRNLFNRRLFWAVTLTVLAQSAMFLSAPQLGIDVLAARTLQMGIWAVVAASVTLLLERRLFPMTIGLVIAFVFAVQYPEYRSLAGGFATLGVTLNMIVIWSRRPK